jgi:hypothetical protein
MKARIYKPSKTAMQSARGNTGKWVLEYELATPRTPEALMGWSGSGDTLNQVRLKFDSQEAAMNFAEKKGLDYTLASARGRKLRPRNYGDNFRYVADEG